MGSFHERLEKERIRLGFTQTEFAALAGKKKGSQIRYESGERSPDVKYLKAIQGAGVDTEFLLTGKRSPLVEFVKDAERQVARIRGTDFEPVDRWDVILAAGDGALNDETAPVRHLAFSKRWLRQMNIDPEMGALVSVRGDSMSPTLEDGDLVLVDRNRFELRSSRVYAFVDIDGSARVKRLEQLPGDQIAVRSDNPSYDTEIRTPKDLKASDWGILGEVLWSGHTWK